MLLIAEYIVWNHVYCTYIQISVSYKCFPMYCPKTFMNLTIYRYVSLFTYPSIYFINMYICLSICLSIHLYAYLSINQSIYKCIIFLLTLSCLLSLSKISLVFTTHIGVGSCRDPWYWRVTGAACVVYVWSVIDYSTTEQHGRLYDFSCMHV